MADISGTCDEQFAPLQEEFARQLDSGAELGASLAVTIAGKRVVDLWGGWSDVDRTVPWGRDTITCVWSLSKTITAIAALVLADRGEIDLYAPVARYWPEFAANGKERVEVRHLLSHTSGVSGWEPPFRHQDVYDWPASTARLAAQAPWWEPGTASAYHDISYGHLVGEVVRRVTGRSLGTFVAEDIAGPLGADFLIGLPGKDLARVSDVTFPGYVLETAPEHPTSVDAKTFVPFDMALTASSEWRQAEIPAANGHGNARSLARINSLISNGGQVDDIRLLSPETIELIFDEQSDGIDLACGIPLRFGIGFGLPQITTFPYIPAGRRCFWLGWGGSIVVNDLDRALTLAYVMNQMGEGSPGGMGTDRTKAYTRTALSCVLD
ncbi:MAG: serine hydrolase domain-containing protein [Propionibacteriaceae bacterium]